MLENNNQYFEVLNNIKRTVINTINRVILNVNRELILMYYSIGKKLNANNKWGSSFIDTLSKDIKLTFPDIKGMSSRNLRYMQKFAKEFKEDEFLQEVLAKLSWNHNQILLDRIKNLDERKWYARQTIINNWSTTILKYQIELKLYERQALLENKTTNFEQTLPYPSNKQVEELLKDPYIFDFVTDSRTLTEVEIEKELTTNITKLLLELGEGFSFIGRQYHIEIDNKDYYIDLLFYNTKIKCYVVVELKTTEFKPEYIGKLNFYLGAIDKYLKTKLDKPTFGILLCKDKKKVTAELALKDVNKPIGVSEYKILKEIPKCLENTLPNINEIEKRLENKINNE